MSGLGVDKSLEVLSAEVLVEEAQEEIKLLLGLRANLIRKGLEVVETDILDFNQEFLLVGFRPDWGVC